MSRLIRILFGIFFALLSAFFLFYTSRLLVVTRGLTNIRPDGQGVYIGAAVFPLVALACGWGAWRLLRRK